MNKKKTNKIITAIISVLATLLFIIVLNFSIHAVKTSKFNDVIHTTNATSENKDVEVYGRISGTWNKEDALVGDVVTNGSTCEYTITNNKDIKVAEWRLKIFISQECYLNQAWNGTVEVHQNVKSGNEKVDTLDLHNMTIDYANLKIESVGEGKNDLMIHLYEGDYIIYIPSNNNTAHEYPLYGANKASTIGMIFYYDTSMDVPTYEITYHYGKSIFQGTEFVIFLCLSASWTIMFTASIVWAIVKRKAISDLEERESMLEETMGLITSFVDAKDSYTNGHSNRVADYTRQLAIKLNLSKKEVQYAYYAAILHDVGKCYVPDEILKKPGRLTDEEFDTIKKHTVYGGEMMKSIKTIKYISDGAKYHHERYDGRGYPEGLSGEAIPFIGRIICVADAFDAMTSSRCYRKALTKEYVVNELTNNLGKQFDPKVGQAMLDLIEENKISIEHWEEEKPAEEQLKMVD